jgi:hypothetical protein
VVWIDDLDGGDPRLERRCGGALVALEREFDVVGGDRIAVVKSHTLAEDEVDRQPVLRCRPRLGEARGPCIARHWLDERVVERVEGHERRDDARSLGGIEPRGRQRDVHGERNLSLGRGRRSRNEGDEEAEPDHRCQ